MSSFREIAAAVGVAPYACGWRDQNGTVRIAWGKERDAGGPLSLDFRGFHGEKAFTGAWKGFPAKGRIAPENFSQLSRPDPEKFAPLELGEGSDSPSREGWDKLCGRIEEELASGRLTKVVPARSKVFPLDPATRERLGRELLTRLFAGYLDNTFRFFVKDGDQVFFGATPELLFRLSNGHAYVPAIAGTRPKPDDPAQEEAAENELRSSPKEQAEHRLVVEGICKALRSLGLSPTHPEQPEILKLRKLIHLSTPIQAASGSVTAEALVAALHPTAAMGGSPQRPAQEFLRQHEALERGLFASPLLFRWEGGEICLVGIRSGLLNGEGMRLFAGAGYVKGADPSAEWRETEKKMDSTRLLLEEGWNERRK